MPSAMKSVAQGGKKSSAMKSVAQAGKKSSAMKSVAKGGAKFPGNLKLLLSSGVKMRPLKTVKVRDLPNLPKSVREKYKKLRFKIRASVEEDQKGSEHGDNYILKKMFQERPYEMAHNRFKASSESVKAIPAGEFFKGRKVLDLGANIGTFTVQAKAGGASGVLAYEPDMETHRLLEANIQLNFAHGSSSADGSIKAVKAGVSADGKPAKIFTKVRKNFLKKAEGLQFRPDRSNRNSLIPDSVNQVRTGEIVKTEKLETIVGKFKPELIKCDIEGVEVGMVADLARNPKKFKTNFASTQELLIYYHVDKWPKLRHFAEFLENLSKLFTLVRPVWTPKIPDPEKGWDWRNELEENPEVEGRPDKELGAAGAKKDILVYCAK